jgi:hypothetical protein
MFRRTLPDNHVRKLFHTVHPHAAQAIADYVGEDIDVRQHEFGGAGAGALLFLGRRADS